MHHEIPADVITPGWSDDTSSIADGSSAVELIDAATEQPAANEVVKAAEQALTAWRAFLDGRWACVGQREGEGYRLLLLRPTTQLRSSRALTVRERQVVAHARLGHSNKRISLELGISESTISTTLHRACGKIGLRRLELARLSKAWDVDVRGGNGQQGAKQP